MMFLLGEASKSIFSPCDVDL